MYMVATFYSLNIGPNFLSLIFGGFLFLFHQPGEGVAISLCVLNDITGLT